MEPTECCLKEEMTISVAGDDSKQKDGMTGGRARGVPLEDLSSLPLGCHGQAALTQHRDNFPPNKWSMPYGGTCFGFRALAICSSDSSGARKTRDEHP
ncbi:hypothetical protein QR685DRAFT_576130 [Neurospora intermedia]|uniref:Uncharacterized protein n=1 Tax=Neurospora intermedia TaxID=5142 RepID=A0ABR3CYV7_NEUIN